MKEIKLIPAMEYDHKLDVDVMDFPEGTDAKARKRCGITLDYGWRDIERLDGEGMDMDTKLEYYEKKSLDNLKSKDNPEELRAKYPDIENETVYILRSTVKDHVKLKLEGCFERAEKARAAGRKVWWYVCDGPTWNCANLHIENKPIDARSLLGAQSLFYKTD